MGNNQLQQEYFGHQHITVIQPARGWKMINLRELWAYRELLWVLTTRDIKVRYKQTVLGAGWAVLRPVLSMLIFTIVFGRLAKLPSDGAPYPVFVFAALLPWTFFPGAIGASGGSLIGSASLVSKVYFPRLIIPLSSVGAGVVDFLIATGVLLLLMIWYGVAPTKNLFAYPILLVLLLITTLGTGTLLSSLTVSYRDFTHITPFLVQIWMFATPVVFPVSLVPPEWHWLIYANPMTGVIEAFRSAFLGKPFDWIGIGSSAFVSVTILAIAIAYFERVERRFADII